MSYSLRNWFNMLSSPAFIDRPEVAALPLPGIGSAQVISRAVLFERPSPSGSLKLHSDHVPKLRRGLKPREAQKTCLPHLVLIYED